MKFDLKRKLENNKKFKKKINDKYEKILCNILYD